MLMVGQAGQSLWLHSVGWLVGWLVAMSVGPHVRESQKVVTVVDGGVVGGKGRRGGRGSGGGGGGGRY